MPFCRGFESHRRSESVIRATLILVACNVSRVMVCVRVAAESSCVAWGAGDQCGVAGSEREKGVRAPFLGWGEWGGVCGAGPGPFWGGVGGGSDPRLLRHRGGGGGGSQGVGAVLSGPDRIGRPRTTHVGGCLSTASSRRDLYTTPARPRVGGVSGSTSRRQTWSTTSSRPNSISLYCTGPLWAVQTAASPLGGTEPRECS